MVQLFQPLCWMLLCVIFPSIDSPVISTFIHSKRASNETKWFLIDYGFYIVIGLPRPKSTSKINRKYGYLNLQFIYVFIGFCLNLASQFSSFDFVDFIIFRDRQQYRQYYHDFDWILLMACFEPFCCRQMFRLLIFTFVWFGWRLVQLLIVCEIEHMRMKNSNHYRFCRLLILQCMIRHECIVLSSFHAFKIYFIFFFAAVVAVVARILYLILIA